MDMTRISHSRDKCSFRHLTGSFSVPRMRLVSTIFPACLEIRFRAAQSPAFPTCVGAVPAHGFPVWVQTKLASSLLPPNGTWLRGHEPLYCSISSQALLRAFSVARRHSPFCFAFRRPSGLGFQQQISRANNTRLRPGKRAKFLAGPTTESTSSALGAGPSAFCALRSSGA
jgi:hypothetical protein